HPAAQWAGTVERVQGDEVVEPLRLGLAQNVAHAGAFKLKDAVGLALGENLICLRIIEWNGVEVENLTRRLANLVDRIVQQRQRAEPEEIHLEQADALDL